MIAFGIDPGSERTGFGVVRAEGSRLICLAHGVIRMTSGAPLVERLQGIYAGLRAELERHAPEQVFLEQIFHHKSARSALVLGQARGVALLAAGQSGRTVGEITPAEVKKAVTGNGRADKHQMQEMVRVLLGLGQVAATDASDALALAIAGATRTRFAQVVADSAQARGVVLPAEWLAGKKGRRRRVGV